MKDVFNLISQPLYEEKCALILLSLSESQIITAEKLFLCYFNDLEAYLQITENETFLHALSNLIYLDPDLFAKTPKIIEPLVRNLKKRYALKCLSMIYSTSDGEKYINESNNDIEWQLMAIMYSDDTRDNMMKVFAAMTIRSLLLKKKTFIDLQKFPWNQLIIVLLECLQTKSIDESLQLCCIHILRILSDFPPVKQRINLIYKGKLNNVVCISRETNELKNDLLQWLDYENYISNEHNKYSKYYI
jgi:hypothetical protein